MKLFVGLSVRDSLGTSYNTLPYLIFKYARFVRLSSSDKECKQKSKTIQDLLAEFNQERREKETMKEKLIEAESKKEYAEKRIRHLEEAHRKAKDEQVERLFFKCLCH